MALDAIHATFQDGMMLRQLELRMYIKVASETRLRVPARIDDQLSAAAGLDVQTARSMTGFTPGGVVVGSAFDVQTGVRAGRKGASVIGMALDAGLVPDERCTFNLRRNYDAPGQRGAGRQNDGRQREACDYGRRQDGAEIHSKQCMLCLCKSAETPLGSRQFAKIGKVRINAAPCPGSLLTSMTAP